MAEVDDEWAGCLRKNKVSIGGTRRPSTSIFCEYGVRVPLGPSDGIVIKRYQHPKGESGCAAHTPLEQSCASTACNNNGITTQI